MTQTQPPAMLVCPKCGADMRSYERNGVTIDQCTGCRGIFLDRGELERLVDAESAFYDSPQRGAPQVAPGGPGSGGGYGKGHHGEQSGGHGSKGRRREGFLGDLFG